MSATVRRVGATLIMVAGLLHAGGATERAVADPRCGPEDRPETGIPGDVPLADQLSGRADEGYSCGLSLVGYSSLGARGGNANMAWAGDCAYIAGDGVAIVDVSDPAAPEHVDTLRTSGSSDTVETLHAVEAADRSILVTGRYGFWGMTGFGQPPAPVDVWDVSDCRAPRLLSTVELPSNAHNLTLSADGRTLWNTLPLQAVDLTDPRQPRHLGNLEDQLRAQGDFKMQYAHEVWPSPDGRRIYVGGQVGLDEELLILDVEHWPEAPARVVGRAATPGHSIRPATIDGRPHLINSDESILNPTAKGCLPDLLTPVGGASRPFVTDISDETAPRVVGEYRLPINEPASCPQQLASMSNASVHYHDVDDPDDTTFAMFSMWNAGLRVVDVRDPSRLQEVAYFNPGRFPLPEDSGGTDVGFGLSLLTPNDLDQAWAHSRYVPETGHIWLTTRSGGFWVLELQPQVREALDLPEMPARYPDGREPRPPETRVAVAAAAPAGVYCTLGVTTGTVGSATGLLRAASGGLLG